MAASVWVGGKTGRTAGGAKRRAASSENGEQGAGRAASGKQAGGGREDGGWSRRMEWSGWREDEDGGEWN